MRPLAQRLDTQTDDELIQVLVPRPGTHGDDGDYVPDFILVAQSVPPKEPAVDSKYHEAKLASVASVIVVLARM